ncbi:unnamed protein product [Callosobruchus maculatus]|uniref:Uncharacterized protein n=1 Tax=Callosobruchus maculatus TaxID=64391 RepID=A0A653DX16_CALMS|nr:unnamed protein product [Callosobruchus maculatus]
MTTGGCYCFVPVSSYWFPTGDVTTWAGSVWIQKIQYLEPFFSVINTIENFCKIIYGIYVVSGFV